LSWIFQIICQILLWICLVQIQVLM
jgi:hypothetical protein